MECAEGSAEAAADVWAAESMIGEAVPAEAGRARRLDEARRDHAVIWAAAALAAALALGPALAPGSLLNLDLVVTPSFPVPAGVWGLGPQLPRLMPLGVPLAWLSSVVGGEVAVKLFLFATLALAFAGAARLAAPAPLVFRLGAGALYVLSPFTLTRLGSGHLGVLAAMAVLPWAVPTLLSPAERPARTFLWSAAMGATGVAGGFLAGLALLVGVVLSRGRGALTSVSLYLLAQLPWLVPGAAVAWNGVHLAGAEHFATRVDGPFGLLRAAAGHGFWQPAQQVGGSGGAGAALWGGAVLALACAGVPLLPRSWGRRVTGLAAVGFAGAVVTAFPALRHAYGAASRGTLGALPRESQRLFPLFLVWLAPAAALGAWRLARSPRHVLDWLWPVVPLLVALLLAAPGLWGIGGRLDPVPVPASWSRARRAVGAAPGPVLALPWHEYLTLSAAHGRLVLNPLPSYLGGDVVSSSDPELGGAFREQADPREPGARALAEQARGGLPVAAGLARLRIRWVVLLHDVDWTQYSSLAREAGLERVLGDNGLDLFRVRGWPGRIVDNRGRPVTLRRVAGPLALVAPSPSATWARPAAAGWWRGIHTAGRTPEGLLRLPGGRGVVWFLPAALTLIGDAATLCGAMFAIRALRNSGVNATIRNGTVVK